jgi:hypothetical protein
MLNLDNVGPEISEPHGRHRTGHEVAEVKDAESRQGVFCVDGHTSLPHQATPPEKTVQYG